MMSRETFTVNRVDAQPSYFHEHSPFDTAIDSIMRTIRVHPERIESFLSSHQKGTRVAANLLSISRVGLGYVALHTYETAKKRGDKQAMIASISALGVIL